VQLAGTPRGTARVRHGRVRDARGARPAVLRRARGTPGVPRCDVTGTCRARSPLPGRRLHMNRCTGPRPGAPAAYAPSPAAPLFDGRARGKAAPRRRSGLAGAERTMLAEASAGRRCHCTQNRAGVHTNQGTSPTAPRRVYRTFAGFRAPRRGIAVALPTAIPEGARGTGRRGGTSGRQAVRRVRRDGARTRGSPMSGRC
jgi:hypothetical protein